MSDRQWTSSNTDLLREIAKAPEGWADNATLGAFLTSAADEIERLKEEMADLMAALVFVGQVNFDDCRPQFAERTTGKLDLFNKWRAEQLDALPTVDPAGTEEPQGSEVHKNNHPEA